MDAEGPRFLVLIDELGISSKEDSVLERLSILREIPALRDGELLAL